MAGAPGLSLSALIFVIKSSGSFKGEIDMIKKRREGREGGGRDPGKIADRRSIRQQGRKDRGERARVRAVYIEILNFTPQTIRDRE